MKTALPFGLLAFTLAVLAVGQPTIWAMTLLLNTAIAFACVSIAFACNSPHIFFKQRDGSLSTRSYIIYWPYMLLNAISLKIYRGTKHEHAFDEVVPGVFLGGRLTDKDEIPFQDTGIGYALDLTSEFSETPFMRRKYRYLNVPLLDSCAPTQKQLKRAVEWVCEKQIDSPVYVHCALGHGRSATVVAAYLLKTKQATCPERAVDLIREHRPRISLNTHQLGALTIYWTELQKIEAERPKPTQVKRRTEIPPQSNP